MNKFFDNMTTEEAEQVQSLTRLLYETRENCKKLLAEYSAENEQALLQKIVAGETGEHPAYDHYLGACILAEARESIRKDIGDYLQEISK